MQVSRNLFNISVRALAESFNKSVMTALVTGLLGNYDLYKRTGYPANFPIPNRDAANQIVKDIVEAGLFLELIQHLVEMHSEGYRGRACQISYLREILKEIFELGFIYDKENKIFVEDSNYRRTRNWGVMREGDEYFFTFLRIDIVKNTQLVRKYSEDVVHTTFADFRSIVEKAIYRRNGRVWSWEGDGGLVAFFFANKNLLAALSGMEIIHELFIYNLVSSRLDTHLLARLAIHNGPCAYSEHDEEIKNYECIKKVMDIEKRFTPPNSITLTKTIFTSLDEIIARNFHPIEKPEGGDYYNYQLRWDQKW